MTRITGAVASAAVVYIIASWLGDQFGHAGAFVPAPGQLDGFRYASALDAMLGRLDPGTILGPLGLVVIAAAYVIVEGRISARR